MRKAPSWQQLCASLVISCRLTAVDVIYMCRRHHSLNDDSDDACQCLVDFVMSYLQQIQCASPDVSRLVPVAKLTFLNMLSEYIVCCRNDVRLIIVRCRCDVLSDLCRDAEVHEAVVRALLQAGRPQQMTSCTCSQLPRLLHGFFKSFLAYGL